KHLRHLLERGTRLVPRMRQRVRANTYSIAPPRWEVDPNFDLDYHLRWVRAGGDRDLRAVLDLAEPLAMSGFDR
ncbi:wax ester/triacylglycerol synthase domain-containing protein, partial [Salmonella enterica]|uniref:wax ester/triacylglycerol synthase domain-containing protein n=1 Tax=Salmonella enterica TaxID=28901 RepID=UPI003CF65307